MKTEVNETTKEKVCGELRKFICSRSGIDWRDYYSTWSDIEGRKAFNQERRRIAKDGQEARSLLMFIQNTSIEVGDILRECTFQERLSWNQEKCCFEYVTGQYYPTEYRYAAASMLGRIIRRYFRECGYDSDRIRKEAIGYFGRSGSKWI